MIDAEHHGQGVLVTHTNSLGPLKMDLTWPEANELQQKLRWLLVDAGCTLRGVL